MKLADFIEANIEPLCRDWMAFARTRGEQGEAMTPYQLRDHAAQLLAEIVADMRAPMSAAQRRLRSQDAGPEVFEAEGAASLHARQRVKHGFGMVQLVSEFRALRASVMRLWGNSEHTPGVQDLPDMSRFNEALDQILADSLRAFMESMEQTRHLFMGILGHDLRGPLSTVMSCAELMLGQGPERAPQAHVLMRSAAQMKAILDDLMEFTGDNLGVAVPVRPEAASLERLTREVVDEMAAIYPKSPVQVSAAGDLHGSWDTMRLRRVVANLLTNALKYGSRDQPISIVVNGERADEVSLSVHNEGPPIPAEMLDSLFEPLTTTAEADGAPQVAGANLGLGLYIVDRIVRAHGGRIDVSSSQQDGTRFLVTFPRQALASG
ncbi:HAMP domain-containing sensor histidine kinase [Xanthomonas sp. NCPPB 2654]|uniref:sensor histidine kinase n=1 Tax=unclassified Xanthomonas TaxID=2643310 RepID=UPI0021E0C841|nr:MULTISPECIES: HAMP domain-containing sensor histidine kinase [unclassified Xanthomonas]MDL5364556.1 HAMP domain-containing sensor histidine kinase [Xanthomonas sp. NCPPB 2654]UYC22127.1 HAMP domain-containing histidine kinase [Xanthomonas sp. CFBP 8443]